MASLPQETPAQDIRNAMTILQATIDMTPSFEVGVRFDRGDLHAIMDRLRAAVAKLEPVIPVCADCGAEGELTGHQDCQFPGDHQV